MVKKGSETLGLQSSKVRRSLASFQRGLLEQVRGRGREPATETVDHRVSRS